MVIYSEYINIKIKWLLNEQSYYPFGLQMAGISDAAIGKLNSENKFNGGSELEEDYGVNLYCTFYRRYDPQIGRFSGVDSKSEASAGISVYQFGGNNPVSMNDPLGDIQTAGYYSHPPGYRDYSLKEPNGSYTDVNGNSWHGDDPLEGASQWMDSGDDGGSDYSAYWNMILPVANKAINSEDENALKNANQFINVALDIWNQYWNTNNGVIRLNNDDMRTIMNEVNKLGENDIGPKKDYKIKTEEGWIVKYQQVNYQFPDGIDAFSIFGMQIIRNAKVIYDWNDNAVGFLTKIYFSPAMFCNGDNVRSRDGMWWRS